MSGDQLCFYLFLLLYIPLLVGYGFHRDFRYEKLVNEKKAVRWRRSGRATAGYGTPAFLLYVFPTLLVTFSLLLGWRLGLTYTGEAALHLMVVLLVYYPILLAALPLLRRVVSARCCAVLGTLPSYLFVAGCFVNLYTLWPPKVVIRLPKNLLPALMGVWLAGAGGILLWKTAEHLIFRRRLLSPARPVTDWDALNLWDYEQQRIERRTDRPIPLMISPAATSPVTIGLFSRTLVTVLPDRPYTQEELELIFRHELRHVQRLDSSAKLFYTFLLAFCWFYPPMWLVYRGATADLELSCDEMVLDRADDTRREAYARLLLSQAGDDRGFSTCLSGSAKALEHRLKSVLHPKKRLEGAILVSLTMVALFALGSLVTVTDTYGTAKEVILDQLPAVRMDLEDYEMWDEMAVMDTLKDLEVTRLSRQGRLPYDIPLDASFTLRSTGANVWFLFSENGYLYVGCEPFYDMRGLYRVEGEVDWEALKRTG